jgi:hypothetical protein
VERARFWGYSEVYWLRWRTACRAAPCRPHSRHIINTVWAHPRPHSQPAAAPLRTSELGTGTYCSGTICAVPVLQCGTGTVRRAGGPAMHRPSADSSHRSRRAAAAAAQPAVPRRCCSATHAECCACRAAQPAVLSRVTHWWGCADIERHGARAGPRRCCSATHAECCACRVNSESKRRGPQQPSTSYCSYSTESVVFNGNVYTVLARL